MCLGSNEAGYQLKLPGIPELFRTLVSEKYPNCLAISSIFKKYLLMVQLISKGKNNDITQ